MKKNIKNSMRIVTIIVKNLYTTLGNAATYITAILGVFIAPEWFFTNVLKQPWFPESMQFVFIVFCITVSVSLIKILRLAFVANASPHGLDTQDGLNTITSEKSPDLPEIIGQVFGKIGGAIIVGALIINISFSMYNDRKELDSMKEDIIFLKKINTINSDKIIELKQTLKKCENCLLQN
jgi:hypothetical protein